MRAVALAPVAVALTAARAAAPLLHTDETSITVAGARRWVQVVSTARLTDYAWHAQRGRAATDAIGLLPRCAGRRIHDGWAAYGHHPGAHGLGNAQHLRALTAVAARPGQAWAADVHALLRAMQRHIRQGRAVGLVASPPDARDAFVARYRDRLAQGHAASPRRPARPTARGAGA